MLVKIRINMFLGLTLFASSSLASDLTAEQRLGKLLFEDINLSINRNQACESCHSLDRLEAPTQSKSGLFKLKKLSAKGFVDAENVEHGTSVSNGSVDRKFGSLNAPSVGYAAFSPQFHWDGELFIGGQFWDGRASDLVDQAQRPFLDANEMAMPSQWAVIQRLRENKIYRFAFRKLFSIKLNKIEEGDAEVTKAFEAMATAIAEFERSPRFNRFDSKFDFEAAGITQYNPSEQRGADLFDDKALCGECHVTEGVAGDGTPALLTDFSYNNLGVPANPQIPGSPARNPGLLGNPNLLAVRGEPSTKAEVEGRQKVMSLRNIVLTAPYMHNGVFKTLEEVVHFYNTRDVLPRCKEPDDISNPGFAKTCWPTGEFDDSKNLSELGNLGLTEQEEADLVAYLKTFTDNYPLWGNSNGLKDPNVPRGTPSPYNHFPVPPLQQ